ncbi:MAG: D-tyrosyl-tRNA(Tyr) deacylase [Candidatus Marinimicrobia bacterium]|nr:D-tyrosyl-tRNA(Tyr) deacylase [Candidatus Neomarinimicrobiota bacterium]
MIVVLQRVKNASVEVDGEIIGKTGKGFLILLGIEDGDSDSEIEFLARKTAEIRIFRDESGKMNRSLADVDGSALVVSQFTLCADWIKGRRPSFIRAAKPEVSKPMVAQFIAELQVRGIHTETGKFGAMMDVALVNDGPVTVVMDSKMKKA